ncbi:MAG: serine/threonine protein kinase [Deltaproteobacteria bacterium]|nr:serine/threonine protein kinase [Deltaproteobacteria bacterium]
MGEPRERAGEVRVGDVLVGRYHILDRIGWGGAGTVFEAVQEPLGRRVAVKVVRTDLNQRAHTEFTARFVKEASLAGSLSHPNVVTVHDYGITDDGVQFVVMELLEGRNLKDAMADGPIEPTLAARWVEGVAAGLRHAHGKQLIHRDVKPSNIFLVGQEDGSERPLLMDFGLVKHMGEVSETRTGTYLGTPLYMAPEQSKGTKAVDGRVDIYALGCVLFHMVTGKPPFDADNALGLALQHLQEPVPPLVTYAGVHLDGALEQIVRKAMAKHPDDRYLDAGELAAALERWRMSYRPATPRPAPRGGVGRGIKAAVGVFAVGGVALGALLLGVLGAGWWYLTRTTEPPTPLMVEAGLEQRVESAHEALAPEAAAPEPEEKTKPAPPPPPREAAPAPAKTPPAPTTAPPAPAKTPPAPTTAPPAPAPAPAEAATRATPDGGLLVEGVPFTPDQAERALYFINAAPHADLLAAGVYRVGISAIFKGRPFRSLEEFAQTPGIGQKTVEAVANATRTP